MTVSGRRPKILLLGMMTKIPVGGVIWLVGQYAVGLQRLGYDVYYVEAHGRVPSMFMEHAEDDPTAKAVAFVADVMARFGMPDRWAFHALHDDGRTYGLNEADLAKLYGDAALIINMHGGTMPLDEHARTGRLVYLGTDPVQTELEVHRCEQHAIDFLDRHVAFFTWALNHGRPDCRLPWTSRFPFVASPPPVVMDFWASGGSVGGDAFTTIGNWRQPYRSVTFDGEVYHWSKHLEFLKFLDVPSQTAQPFELALSSYEPDDKAMLEAKQWRVRHALEFSTDPDAYRRYIQRSRGEFTVAKDQNVRLRTGWFSERSAQYLAAGRPVVTQDTGFGNILPTGHGLFAFSTPQEVVEAVDRINADYQSHCQAAAVVAREHFAHDIVLPKLLAEVGV